MHVNESTRLENKALINAYTDTLLELSISGSGDLVEGLITYKSGDKIMNEFIGLTEINVLTGIEKLTNNSFKNTTSLKNIILPTTLKDIDTNVFENCISLTNIELPSSLTKISENSFTDCTNLEVISYSTGLTNIDESFNYFTNDYDINVLELNDTKTKLKEITDSNLYKKVIKELGEKDRTIVYTTVENGETVTENITIKPLEIVKEETFIDANTKLEKEVIYLSHGDKIIDWFMYNGEKYDFEYDFVNKKFTIRNMENIENVKNDNNSVVLPDTNGYSEIIFYNSSGNQVFIYEEDNITPIKFYKKGTDVYRIINNEYIKVNSEKITGIKYVVTNTYEESPFNSMKINDNETVTIFEDENDTESKTKLYTYCNVVKDTIVTFKLDEAKSYYKIINDDKVLWLYVRHSATEIPTKTKYNEVTLTNNILTDNKLYIPLSRVVIENYNNNINTNTGTDTGTDTDTSGRTDVNVRFGNLVKANSIKLPNSMTNGTHGYFENYYSLTSIELPQYKFLSFGSNMLQTCYNLKSINIPTTLGHIDAYVFSNCRSLKSIKIPKNISRINMFGFSNCRSLTEITIPDNVTEIGYCTFNKCTSLQSVILPKNETFIKLETSLFAYCSSLTGITISDNIVSIEGAAFFQCTSLTEITIPNSVTSIGKNTFKTCTSLKSVVLPTNKKFNKLEEGLFYQCSSLTEITIPENVTSIGNQVFYKSSSLESIRILGTISEIGTDVFTECNGDKTKTIKVYLNIENNIDESYPIYKAIINAGLTQRIEFYNLSNNLITTINSN